MSHCRLLFVGGRENLEKIFEACPDSSSETAAEMTIGADWVSNYDWISEEEKARGWTTDDFTKDNEELYKQIIEGQWYECYDIRDINHYGSFDCLNCSDFEPYIADKEWQEREERNKQRVIRDIQKLPNDTLFHFADSHW